MKLKELFAVLGEAQLGALGRIINKKGEDTRYLTCSLETFGFHSGWIGVIGPEPTFKFTIKRSASRTEVVTYKTFSEIEDEILEHNVIKVVKIHIRHHIDYSSSGNQYYKNYSSLEIELEPGDNQ